MQSQTSTSSVTAGTTRVSDNAIVAASRDSAAIRAANLLMGDGYTVTSIQTETRDEPIVWLAFDRRLAQMVERDLACYYSRGIDEGGAYRVGQFRRNGCIVRWRERRTDGTWRN